MSRGPAWPASENDTAGCPRAQSGRFQQGPGTTASSDDVRPAPAIDAARPPRFYRQDGPPRHNWSRLEQPPSPRQPGIGPPVSEGGPADFADVQQNIEPWFVS